MCIRDRDDSDIAFITAFYSNGIVGSTIKWIEREMCIRDRGTDEGMRMQSRLLDIFSAAGMRDIRWQVHPS